MKLRNPYYRHLADLTDQLERKEREAGARRDKEGRERWAKEQEARRLANLEKKRKGEQ